MTRTMLLIKGTQRARAREYFAVSRAPKCYFLWRDVGKFLDVLAASRVSSTAAQRRLVAQTETENVIIE